MVEKPTHGEMELTFDSFDVILDRILNSLFVAIAIIAILPLIASLYRCVTIGWQNIMYLHIIAYLAVSITAIFHRRVLFSHKALILIVLSFLIGCGGVIKFGILGSGIIFMIFSTFFTMIFFGVKYGVVAIMAGLVVLITTTFGVNQGWLTFDFDIEAYALAPSVWISKIVSFALFTAILIASLGRLITHLIASSHILQNRTVELKQINETLMEKLTVIEGTEEALRKSVEKFRNVYNTAPLTFVVWDQDTCVVDWNKKAEEVFGWLKEEVVGRSFFDFLIPEKDRPHVEDVTAIVKGGFPARSINDNLTKDGKIITCEWNNSILHNNDGSIIGAISLGLDISDRKQAEKALRENEEKYRTLFEKSVDGILITDIETNKIKYANPALCRLLGYSEEEIKGLGMLDILPKDKLEYVISEFEANVKGQKTLSENIPFLKKDGAIVCGDISGTTTLIDGKKCSIGFFRDITDKKHLEAQLQQTQKMEAIGTLAGGIAHDFNNILSAVIGYTEISMLEAQKGSNLERNLEEVLKAGERAKDLVQQILAFSRQREQEQKPVQVKLIVKEALKLLRASIPSTIKIEQNIQSNALVMGDSTQIHQILMNLCTNAAHAMEDKGGVLTVSLSDIELDSDFISSHPDFTPGAYINLTVSDTGHGIPPAILEKIFDPFFTTKEKGEGTGMGLSVVHGIVHSHGGAIRADSEPGKGSTFKVLIPAIEKHLKPKDRIEKHIPTGTERILFIDDEPSIVNVGKLLLESLGYDVVTRNSSIEALEYFKFQPDKIDLVITDMTMPKMTGDVLAKELMRIRSDIPVILCTGFSTKINVKKAMAMGIRAFVSKPILKREIAETIKALLDGK